jgi:PAS domain S-box-containing protein
MSHSQDIDQAVKYYKSIFQESPDAVLFTYPHEKKIDAIFYANSAAEELFGYSEQEICEISWKGIVDNNDPQLTPFLNEISNLGKATSELTFEKKDGTRFRGEISTNILDQNTDQSSSVSIVRDITQRTNAEMALKESENRLRSVLENSPDVIYRYNLNTEHYEYISPAIRSLGFEPEELTEMSNTEVISRVHPDDLPGLLSVLSEINETGNGLSEYRFMGKDGNYLWWSNMMVIIRDSQGKPVYRDGYVRDITKRKKAEYEKQMLLESEKQLSEELQTSNEELQSITEELQASNGELQLQKSILESFNVQLEDSKNELQTILDLVPMVIWIAHDPECLKITGNAFADEITMQVPRGENISKSAPDDEQVVSYEVFRNGIQLNPEDLPAQIAASTGEKVEETEIDLVFSDGRIVNLLISAVPLFDYNGNVRGSITAGMDVTNFRLIEKSLRMSEERLRLAQNQGNVGVWDWNTVTDELHFTPELEELYGLSPGTIKTYEDWRKLTHPDDIIKTEEERDRKISNHEHFDLEFRVFHNSGNIHWLTARGGAIYNDQGEAVRVLGINMDITERKMIEDALRESNKELEQFAYVSSHDLQEPLRMVTSFTQLLERRYKGKLDDDADDYIEFIVDGAKRMKTLIDDLLLFSRLTTEPRKYENINLNNVLDVVLLNLKSAIEENNVKITLDQLPNVTGDASRFIQVFQNLIGNAIKFNDKEIPEIHISAQKAGNEWIFIVRDNGIGMDKKYFETIFSVFKRLHTRQDYEGTGIGLAIIKKIIQQHGGHIWVKSEIGKGSTFYFTIPV